MQREKKGRERNLCGVRSQETVSSVWHSGGFSHFKVKVPMSPVHLNTRSREEKVNLWGELVLPGWLGTRTSSKLSSCENNKRALNTRPRINTGRRYYSPRARQDEEHCNILSHGSSVIVGAASYWFPWGWSEHCCRHQSCEPPIAHSLSLALEVADENYPEHGYAANATNALNLQDMAIPKPR